MGKPCIATSQYTAGVAERVDAADLKKNLQARVSYDATLSGSDSSLWEHRLRPVPNLLNLAAFCRTLDTI